MASALREALCAYSEPDVADEIIDGALLRDGRTRLPDHPREMREFVDTMLFAALVERLGEDAAEGAMARLDPMLRVLDAQGAKPEPEAATPADAMETLPPPQSNLPAVIYVVAERPVLASRLRLFLGGRAEVLRARSLDEVIRASTLRVGWRSAVLLDARDTSAWPTSGTLEHVLVRARIVVWGDDAAITELRTRTRSPERLLACGLDVSPEDVALLVELHLAVSPPLESG